MGGSEQTGQAPGLCSSGGLQSPRRALLFAADSGESTNAEEAGTAEGYLPTGRGLWAAEDRGVGPKIGQFKKLRCLFVSLTNASRHPRISFPTHVLA